MRIEAGDFPKGTELNVITMNGRRVPVLITPTDVPPRDYAFLDRDSFVSLQLVSDDVVKSQAGATGGAILGGLLLGPVGAVGGALMGGNKRKVTFAFELKDGRRMLVVATPEEWTEFRNALF